ncbi:MAG: DUF438 domain-containing protein [Eubacterium sp.]|nr:DUF438 domain-containing protein [Eubacterium sp.]
MAKKIDFNKSVYELVQEYPELRDILSGVGFREITKKGMLGSVGRIMTIPKGAKMKNISMMDVVMALMTHGFEIEGEMPELKMPWEEAKDAQAAGDSVSREAAQADGDSVSRAAAQAEGSSMSRAAAQTEGGMTEERNELLKSYLRRLGSGEDLEAVRADFVKNFRDVDASEIMRAEQDLLKSGTPLEEVQKLCDVHSALFHGATREEKIANAEKAVEDSLMKKTGDSSVAAGATGVSSAVEKKRAGASVAEQRTADFSRIAEMTSTAAADPGDRKELAASLASVPGHPLNLFERENQAIETLLLRAREAVAGKSADDRLMSQLREIAVHYAKKGDLLYPHLKVRYDISGPSDVMWTVDDEIRDEISALSKDEDHDDDWYGRLSAVLDRAEEMIYKENNILFPICAVNFTAEDWYSVYRDSGDYTEILGQSFTDWEEAEQALNAEKKAEKPGLSQGEVVMPGGHMTVPQLTALLNTIPMEISFIDADNINRYFNEGPKVFKRAGMAIDREVFSCHPPKVEPMVRSILDSFRDGSRDSVPVWMEKNGRTMLVNYLAVRDQKGNYLGAAELVQDMEFAKEHFAGH